MSGEHPVENVTALLAGDAYVDEVHADQAEARRLGLTGIPFTVLAGKQAVVGVVSVDALRRAINAALDAALDTTLKIAGAAS